MATEGPEVRSAASSFAALAVEGRMRLAMPRPSRLLLAAVLTCTCTLASQADARAAAPLYEHAALGGGEEGDWFGYSVAMSSDAGTLIVGGPHAHGETGAAWVFVRSAGGWTPQAELSPPPEASAASSRAHVASGSEEEGLQDHFGARVAISADGNTAIVTSPGTEAGVGAAYVYTRAGSSWTRTTTLTGGAAERGEGRFGRGVALTPDGSTAVVGAPHDADGIGAAWLFTRHGGEWARGAELTAASPVGEAHFGGSVAISAAADTVLVGGPGDDGFVGKAWVFARHEEEWSEQATLGGAPAAAGQGHFGRDVALSAQGDTALVGAPGDRGGAGGAFVFTRSAGHWGQQGPELSGSDESGEGGFGFSDALSADGSTALIGGPQDKGSSAGAAWEFASSGGVWAQQGAKLAAKGGEFGYDVALDAEADVALIGGVRTNTIGRGTAWVFTTEPPAPEEETRGSKPPPRKPPPTQRQVDPTGGVLAFAQAQAPAPGQQQSQAARASRVALAGRTIYVTGKGRAAIRLLCSGGTTRCAGKLTLAAYRRAGRRIVKRAIGTARFSIAPGRATVTLTLTRLGRGYMRASHGKLTGALAIVAPPFRAQSAGVKLRVQRVTVRRKPSRR
jgi:hypothetical protein